MANLINLAFLSGSASGGFATREELDAKGIMCDGFRHQLVNQYRNHHFGDYTAPSQEATEQCDLAVAEFCQVLKDYAAGIIFSYEFPVWVSASSKIVLKSFGKNVVDFN